jgi:hypothetical protein
MLESCAYLLYLGYGGSNMNIKNEHALPLCYISVFLIQDHMLNWNMENHLGKPYNHKAYGSALAE